MDRLISLSIGVDGDDDYSTTFFDMAELARGLGSTHDYVNMSAQVVNNDEPDEPEHPYHDENTTINKVRKVLMEHGLTSELTSSAISDMLSVGILFRERAGTTNGT